MASAPGSASSRRHHIDESQLQRLRPTSYVTNGSARLVRHASSQTNNDLASTSSLSKELLYILSGVQIG